MTPSTDRDEAGCPARCAVAEGIEAVDLVDLLIGDEEWVQLEFDAIVAAGWGGAVPPGPASSRESHWPRRAGRHAPPTPVPHPPAPLPGGTAPARQRGPPA